MSEWHARLYIAYLIISPWAYLSFQGWAGKNLIDTDNIDKWAFKTWLIGVLVLGYLSVR